MHHFNITGMSCAACSARVEKAVKAVDGVTDCNVSLLTNSMTVGGSVSPEKIIKAVTDAGYGAEYTDEAKSASYDGSDELKDTETPKIRNRLIWSLVFLLVLMYISMGHMMWNFPLPSFMADNHIAMGLVQLLLCTVIMVINQKFFISGFKGLIHRSPNMDSLVALGSGASFAYSVWALFAMTDAQLKGNNTAVMSYMHDFYFESAAMIITLITVGKLLEAYSKGKTTNALKSLVKLTPKTACIIRDGEEVTVPTGDVRIDDIFVVRPGESIPADGIVVEGHCAADESSLTGESIPVDKKAGDKVSAGTINESGFVKCKAAAVGKDTALSQIIQMVSDAASTKAPIAKIADKVSGVFVPAVIVIAIITLIVWLICGEGFGYALNRSVSVLVISCPCALGLATPVAIMVGNGVGAKNGILFKTAVSLEQTGKTQIVVLDKTGTVTKGEPKVTDIIPADNVNAEKLMTLAYSAEIKSEHPLAKAIVSKGKEMSVQLLDSSDFQSVTGSGITAVIGSNQVLAGSLEYVSGKIKISDEVRAKCGDLAKEGKTPLLFSENDSLTGVIAVADTIKEDSPSAVAQLKNMGIKVVMLTGDNKATADAIGRQAGVDSVVAGVLPDGKEKVIQKLKKYGKVAMVGDGINDAPALTSADTGIAIGAGTDVAIDAADVVLMNSKLSDVPSAIRLSRATLTNIRENLFWAFIYNVIGIPLAAGIWIPIFGWQLNPMFAAAAMSLSSFCVVTNALRLNLFKLHSSKRDKKIKQIDFELKEMQSMTKTMKIEGMMCPHCEATVKKTLEALPQVDEARVSHTDGEAVLTLNSDIPDSRLKKAVEEQGYKVL
ncbi:MAG: heavy metal translocating P-type ATPase [Eubacterium sp.]